MKTIFTIAGLMVLAVSTVMAQQRVILESGTSTTVFGGENAFVQAYDEASDGDTLYLPGLQFSLPSFFQKRLTIYGTGYHPDHAEVTGQTRLTGTLRLYAEASGSRFEGILFAGPVHFQAQIIENLSFHRCYFEGSISLNGSTDAPSDNISFSECIILGDFNGHNTKNLIFHNNILFNPGRGMFINIRRNAWVHNNIIIGKSSDVNSTRMIYGLSDSLFENNIFYDAGGSRHFSDVSNNTFNNNVFNWNPTGDASNTWNNNFTGVNIPDIFINYTGDSFSYEADYNLVEPEGFEGTTGNQVSIYGGLSPFKENTRPSNPQIMSVDIGQGTDEKGMLHIQVEVEAQDH